MRNPYFKMVRKEVIILVIVLTIILASIAVFYTFFYEGKNVSTLSGNLNDSSGKGKIGVYILPPEIEDKGIK